MVLLWFCQWALGFYDFWGLLNGFVLVLLVDSCKSMKTCANPGVEQGTIQPPPLFKVYLASVYVAKTLEKTKKTIKTQSPVTKP